MPKALWWKRDFTQLSSMQQHFRSAFHHKKKRTNLCFPLGLMEHLSDKPDHQVSHNCHPVPHCIYFCFIMFYLLLWKLPPPTYSILASEERQEMGKGLNISVFSNPFLLLPLWLLIIIIFYLSFLLSFLSVLQVCLPGWGGHCDRQGQLRHELSLLRYVCPGHPGTITPPSPSPLTRQLLSWSGPRHCGQHAVTLSGHKWT